MKTLIKLAIALGFIAAVVAVGYSPARKYMAERNRVTWEQAAVVRGDITRYVNSTGTIKPVLSVSVGSFVSGPIVELNVDFNDEVKKGEVLARVDPRLFLANVEREEATLATQQAQLEQTEAELQQALNNYNRGKRLREKNRDFLSDREMDVFVFTVKSLQARRKLAKAAILQARASLETSRANLNYCEITAPVDGVVIDRKIDPGQTLAAQFQTPELFIVAPDLREKVHVFASVDEADMGLIQKAERESRPVTFTVDAHPEDVFEGKIEQIRVSSTVNQNVVTYPVVIAAANPDLKLLPGMTASISFEVDSTTDVPKIPNSALRFYPDDVSRVRDQDKKLLDVSQWKSEKKSDDDSDGDGESEDEPAATEGGSETDENEISDDDPESMTAAEKASAAKKKKKKKRHVWVVAGEKLKAVEIRTGLTENRYTELKSGDLKIGDKLVTGKQGG